VNRLTFWFSDVRYVALPSSFWSPGTPMGAGGLGTRSQRDGAVFCVAGNGRAAAEAGIEHPL